MAVMAGLDPATHIIPLLQARIGGRNKSGHDAVLL
jgi:hypothetical protein